MTKNRNNLVELARFLFSLLVVGYHAQMSMYDGVNHIFENGLIAVEFFFILSGYFMARSIEKINANDNGCLIRSYGKFMWGKLKSVLPTHIVANALCIIIIAIFATETLAKRLLLGLPSLFLIQNVVVWDATIESLITPEWYISAMLLCMAIMMPIAIALRKKIKGVFVPLVLAGMLIVVVLAVGFPLKWQFGWNLSQDIRAFGELIVGMLAYHLSTAFLKKEFNTSVNKTLKVVEIICYLIPIILGIVPIPESLQAMCIAFTVVCTFMALAITFSGKGIVLRNERINKVFGYLGGVSLAIYLFHYPLIDFLGYVYPGCELWAKILIIFPMTMLVAIIYNLCQTFCKMGIAKIIDRRKENAANKA